MKKSFGFIIILILLAVSVLFSACSKQQDMQAPVKAKTEKNSDVPRIGFSVATDTFIIERWNKDIKIFTSAVSDLGGDVLLQMSAGGNAAQIQQIEYLLSQNIDVLVVIPHDCDLISGVIQEAGEKGVPVIAYDRIINNVPLAAYVSFDNRQVGSLMAEAAVKACPKGNYLILNGSIRDTNVYEVNAGIYSILNPYINKGSIRVGEEIWLDEWSFDEALQKLGEVFAVREDFDAILAGNDQIAEAAVQLLAERRLAGNVVVTGQDAELAACQRLVEGSQLMTVYKPIDRLATKTAQIAMMVARREELPEPSTYVDNGSSEKVPYFRLAPIAVTLDNIEDTVFKDGFHSRQDVYRTSVLK
ncbi:MAG: substrate-binding domain-containing protein [Treponema sp.]|nr:substrate-binding domain-containing protein [Candidatus Treponema caballi]